MSKRNFKEWTISAIMLVVLGVPALGLLYVGGRRAADVYYKTGWMVVHWRDAEKFPPGSNLCMHQFCTRADTTLKHVGGRRGYTSEVQYHYCPLHEPSFVHFDSRFDGFLYFCYWIVSIICSAIPPFLLFLPTSFLGERKKWFITPFVVVLTVVDIAAWVILIPAWVMFAWW